MTKTIPIITRLRALRKRRGWTRWQCAEALNVNPRTLKSWEEGRRSPKPIVREAIERFVDREG